MQYDKFAEANIIIDDVKYGWKVFLTIIQLFIQLFIVDS